MCSYGLKSAVEPEKFLRKSMTLLSTHYRFKEVLGVHCEGLHDHARVQGRDTQRSGVYPDEFAEKVVKVIETLPHQSAWVSSSGGGPPDDGEELKVDTEPGRGASEISFKGSVSGKVAGALRRLHQNLGHPSNREMVRHLTLGGASKEMIAAAQNLKCSTCARCARPQAHRVAKPSALLDFNEAVAIDIIFIDTLQNKNHLALNMVDVASSYQVVVPLESRHANVVAETFYKFWVSWAGTPVKLVLDLDTGFQDSFWELTSGDGIGMRRAAGQAHWQNGIAERYGGAWKSVWDKLCVDYKVMDDEMWEATAAVNEARNTFRNKSGFSPRQWVFGSNGRLVPDPEDESDLQLSALSHTTSDEKMARKQNLRVGARMAFFHYHSTDALQKALHHRARVFPRTFKPGDMVYVYREVKTKGKRASSKWLGPATVIGPEGSNYWVARGGRCLLAAGEHLRAAEHEEVSEALRIKAALHEIKSAMDADFEEAVDEDATAEMEVEDEMMFSALPDDDGVGAQGGGVQSSARYPQLDEHRMARALQAEERHRVATRKAQSLDDVPASVKRRLAVPASQWSGAEGGEAAHHPQFFVKKVKSPEALEKALEKEIPWNLIDHQEKQLYVEAEKKQWQEHLDSGAVRPLTLEESAQVEKEVGKDRILNCRFLYRDKNLAKRRKDPSIPCKAKARLCVGGQRDPDLGNIEMSVDAPTANRHSVLLGLLMALSRGWLVAIGDIRAAFLNGVEAPRKLFFRQPIRGIPGLYPGQLVEIVKGVFGLSSSPKLWWLKLSGDLLELEIQHQGKHYKIEQNEIDPCAFRVTDREQKVCGMIFTHVDDLLVMAEVGLHEEIKKMIGQKFPVDDWESGKFEYIGCEYQITPDEVTITQTGYVESRLEKISIPGHLRNEDPATPELMECNRTTIGCLSWLAKQTRADIQFQVAQAQRVQGNPTISDIKETNKIVDAAKNHKHEGITLKRIPQERMVFLAYHDAAWANADLEGDRDQEWDGDFKKASQLASLVLVADRCVVENKIGKASIVDWRSKASARICRSTFAGETMACGDALETCLYLRSLMLSFQHGRLIHEKDAGKYMDLHLCTDCKSLYDHLHKAGTPKPPTERRLALDLAAIRQSLYVEAKHQWRKIYGEGSVRPEKPRKPPLHWVPTDKQLADILTKKMKPDDWWKTVSSGLLILPFMVPSAQTLGIQS